VGCTDSVTSLILVRKNKRGGGGNKYQNRFGFVIYII